MTTEGKILELGLILPPAPPSSGIYKPVIITGNSPQRRVKWIDP